MPDQSQADTRIVGDGYAPGTDRLLHATIQARDGSRYTMWRQGAGWSAGPEPRSIDEIAAPPTSEGLELPDFEFDGARNNQQVIRKFCELQAAAWRAVIDGVCPADCFCGKLQNLDVAPVRTFDDGYRNDLRAFKFIEWATWAMICAVKPGTDVPSHVPVVPHWHKLSLTASRPDPGCFAGGDDLDNLRRENADLNRLLADFRADVTRRVPLGEPVAEAARVEPLQSAISSWHAGVFPGRRPLVTAKKLLEEASECHIAAKGEATNWPAVVEEAADCAIVCYVLASMAEVDLEQTMRRKLATLIERGSTQRTRDTERGIEPPEIITDWTVETWSDKK